MKTIVLFIASLLFVSSVSALPPCPEDPEVRWHNCQGTYTYADGGKSISSGCFTKAT